MLQKISHPILIAILCFVTVQIPLALQGVSLGDEGLLHYYAQEILRGKIPYRDFFMVLAPGMYYVQALITSVVGSPLLITGRITYIVVVSFLLLVFYFYISLPRAWAYAVWICVAFCFLWAGGFGLYTQEAMLIFGISLLCLKAGVIRGNMLFFLLAGICATGILFFKQSIALCTVPLVMMMSYLLPTNKKYQSLIVFLIGCGLSMGMYVGYFGIHHALSAFFYYQFMFASTVKSFQYDYVFHRIMMVPLLWILSLIFFSLPSKRAKVMLLSGGLVGVSFYLFGFHTHLSRFHLYLFDPLFYFTTLIYITPTISLCLASRNILQQRLRHEEKEIIVASLFLLALYFGISSSGYNENIVKNTTILFFPLLVLIIRFLKKYIPRYSFALYTSALVLFCIMTFFVAYPQIDPRGRIYHTYMKQQQIYRSSLVFVTPLLISFSVDAQLHETLHSIDALIPPTGTFLCFPKCPMLLVWTHRQSSSFYNYFYRESFQPRDQGRLVADLRAHPSLIVLQKQGEIEPYVNEEMSLLPLFLSYVHTHYVLVRSSADFDFYMPK